ncbi:MAG: 4Fe-4S binding protein [Desulfobacterales bacterium]
MKDNGVAIDAVMAKMMGCEPGQLRFLQKAKEAGLGDYELNTIEVIGQMKQLPDFKLPPLGGETIINNKPLQDRLHSLTLLLPQANPDLCTGCGTCVDQCAAMALSMNEENLPQVDADSCITCFCCQEICPEKAMTLQ